MSVLAVHLLLHWKWIVHVVRHRPNRETSGLRLAMGVFGLVSVIALSAAPHISSTEQVTEEDLKSMRNESAAADLSADPEASDVHDDEAIRGSMTLGEISRVNGVPLSYLAERLNLPADVSSDERAGRLLRSHGLEMQDLRTVLADYEASQ
jgi:hypothetical protein